MPPKSPIHQLEKIIECILNSNFSIGTRDKRQFNFYSEYSLEKLFISPTVSSSKVRMPLINAEYMATERPLD